MSERFENGYIALVLTCVFGLAVIAFVGFNFFYLKGYQASDQEHQGYYAQRDATESAYQECLRISATIDEASSCINHSSDTSREQERAEQDLNAQRQMAQWAEGMLWATLVIGTSGILLTAVGVFLLKRTLEATVAAVGEGNRAAEAALQANEIMLTGQRPWAKMEIGPCEAVEFQDGRTIAMRVAVTVTNVGTVPAQKFSAAGNMVFAQNGSSGPPQFSKALEAAQKSANQTFTQGIGVTLFPNESITIKVNVHMPITEPLPRDTDAMQFAFGIVSVHAVGGKAGGASTFGSAEIKNHQGQHATFKQLKAGGCYGEIRPIITTPF